MATRLAQRLMKGARSGDAEARISLGKLYLSGGEGLAANPTAALHWLSLAAQQGFDEANALIAECVAQGSAGSEIPHYLDACQTAADQGHAAGHCALGDIYASKSAASPDFSKAQASYRTAARAGHIGAAKKLGLLLAQSGKRETLHSYEEAAHWLRLAAKAGDSQAAMGLGKLLWHNGDCKAVSWLEPEARRGDPEAMYCLGEILCRQGDRERAQRGAYWLERAVRKGHAHALWYYGRLHVKQFSNAQTGLPHSPLQATRLLERAAAEGVSEAWWDLARIYEMRRFSRRDPGRARQYLEQAANASVVEAQLELGKRLCRYKNDPAARIAAGHWLSLASKQGSIEAREALAHVADRAYDWPTASLQRQETLLNGIREEQPIIAARLELAARFSLSTRETLFVHPPALDHGWCIEVDLTRQFKRRAWRLIAFESAVQRNALDGARDAFAAPGSAALDLNAATTMGRVRQMRSICLRLRIDPAAFMRDWKI